MSDRRNPYLILGIDFGASPVEASDAFARVVRRIKSDPDAPYTVEDATWALHQIEQSATDHSTDVSIYRVPADPDLFRTQVPVSGLNENSCRLPRQSPPSDEALVALRDQALFELLAPQLSQLSEALRAPVHGSNLGAASYAKENSSKSTSHLPGRSAGPSSQTRAAPRLPADWYPDPTRDNTREVWLRYWNGDDWTEMTLRTDGTMNDPPGWYPDPNQDDPDQVRFWDGSRWSEQTRPWQ